MTDLIDYTIICNECKHPNKFKLKGEIIQLFSGGTLPVLRESIEGKICERCGVILK